MCHTYAAGSVNWRLCHVHPFRTATCVSVFPRFRPHIWPERNGSALCRLYGQSTLHPYRTTRHCCWYIFNFCPLRPLLRGQVSSSVPLSKGALWVKPRQVLLLLLECAFWRFRCFLHMLLSLHCLKVTSWQMSSWICTLPYSSNLVCAHLVDICQLVLDFS